MARHSVRASEFNIPVVSIDYTWMTEADGADDAEAGMLVIVMIDRGVEIRQRIRVRTKGIVHMPSTD